MTIVVDTSVVLALLDRGDRDHATVRDWVAAVDEDLFTSPLAVAEIDRLLATHGGPAAREALRGDLDSGAYNVRWWADGVADMLAVVRDRPELGLTDASLVALAERLRTRRIATLDVERFRPVTDRDGKPFTLLPADA